ncbi:MAG: CdaR family protein [Vicinamibacterales bacterium]
MARFRVRHLGLKVLSVAVATLLWLVVTGDPVVERTLRVGLELQRTPEDLELVGAVPETVSVRLRGAASRLAALGSADVSVVVDLDGVRPGRRLFALTPSQVTAPFGVEVTQVTPAALPLVFEPTAWAIVPVRARIDGTPAAGHSVSNVSVTPSQVRVEGPASAVRGLTELFTEPVSVERATSLVREAVTIDATDTGLRLGGSATVVVTVTVAADTTERTLIGVPIVLRGGSPGRLTPAEATVTVQGAAEVVGALEPRDVALFVDAQGGAARRDLVVQAESSPRFVVRAIAPATVTYQRTGGRR